MALSKEELANKLIDFIGYDTSGKPTRPFFSITRSDVFPVSNEIAYEVSQILGTSIDNSFYDPLVSAYNKYGGVAFVRAEVSKRTVPSLWVTYETFITTNSLAPYILAERRYYLKKLLKMFEYIASKDPDSGVIVDFPKLLLGQKAEDALVNLVKAIQEAFKSGGTVSAITVDFPWGVAGTFRWAIGLAEDTNAQETASELDSLFSRYGGGRYRYISTRSNKRVENLSPLQALALMFRRAGAIAGKQVTIFDEASGKALAFIIPVMPGSPLISLAKESSFIGWVKGRPTVLAVNPIPDKVTPSGLEIHQYVAGQASFITVMYMYSLGEGAGSSTNDTGGTGSAGGTGGTGGTGSTGSAGGAGGIAPGGTFIASDWAWCVTRFPNDPTRQQQCLAELQRKTEQDVTKPVLIGTGVGLGTILLIAILAGGAYFLLWKR